MPTVASFIVKFKKQYISRGSKQTWESFEKLMKFYNKYITCHEF